MNTTATVEVLRDGQTLLVKALIAERPAARLAVFLRARTRFPAVHRPRAADGGVLDGVKVEELTITAHSPDSACPTDTQGVVVSGSGRRQPSRR